MAEIRSTFDLVMERAAKLSAGSSGSSPDESILHDGMRAGAAFLRGDSIDIAAAIQKVGASEQNAFKKGLLQTFLRNVVLPRGEEQVSEGALTGLNEIGKFLSSSAHFGDLIVEMRSILSRYVEHKKQLKGQLEANFASQMAMLEQNYAHQTGVRVKMSSAQHPKFAEEWQKTLASLNHQYESALGQYKDALTRQLTS